MISSRFTSSLSGLAVLAVLMSATMPLTAQNSQRREGVGNVPALARERVAARAVSDGPGAFISWRSSTEEGVLGYDIFRYGLNGRERVNDGAIFGGGLGDSRDAREGRSFKYFDADGSVGSLYEVEIIRLNGKRQTVSTVVAQPVQDISPVAGYSSLELIEAERGKVSEIDSLTPRYPKALAAEMVSSLAPENQTIQKWVAAQAAAKIAVRQDGIYRITRTSLQTAGFNVATPTKYWRLFADGVEVPIRFAADGSYFDFYGRARDTRESDTRVYYLVGDTVKGLRMPTLFGRSSVGPAATSAFTFSSSRKFRTGYITTLLNGDLENFFGPLVSNSSSSSTIPLLAVNPTQTSVSLTVRLQGIVNLSHAVEVSFNGTVLGTMTGTGRQSFTATFNVPASALLEGNNSVALRSTITSAFSMLDTLTVNYSRIYRAESNRLSYLSDLNKQVTVGGFSNGSVVVYDITNTSRPSVVSGVRVQETSAGVFSASVTTNRQRALYAVSDSGVLSPASVTLNTPSDLSASSNQGQMLIVSHKNFMTEANAWATYRRGQGMNVKVVDVEDVFDEFAYGSSTTDGLNAFFSHAKQNWTVKPDYVLLIGDATYDYRGYEGRPFANYIPSRLFDTLYEETASDDALVDFNGDGLAEISIGRIPARTSTFITQMLTKLQNFEVSATTALSSRGAAFAHDEPNGYDFAGLNARLAARLPAGTPTVAVSRLETDSKNKLLAALNAGPMIVNYAGHGSTGIWYSTGFFGQNDALALTNSSRLTVFMMLTCLNGFFHYSDSTDGLAESALKAANGGAVIAWASTGKTTPDVQDLMANRFFTKLSDGSMPRIGDLIRDSKTVIFAGRDVRLSWVLLGDPAMKVR